MSFAHCELIPIFHKMHKPSHANYILLRNYDIYNNKRLTDNEETLKLFPKHCSEVCFKKVSFPLTKENMVKKSVGKTVFSHTSYIVLTNGRQWAVARIQNSKMREDHGRSYFSTEMFKQIGSIEIISLPEDTGFVKDPTVNVNNPSLMAKVAEREGKETVVVHGKFEHISFISNEKTIPLIVFDFEPPNPSKLMDLVPRALDTGRIQKPIKIIPKILNLNKLAKTSGKPFAMFSCHAGDSNFGKNVLFLVGNPDISSIGIDNIVHVGCDASLRIFKSVYGKKPTFIDVCPLHRKKKKGTKCIARCGKMAPRGHQRIGDTAYVNFDPSLCDVEEAIMDIFEIESVKAASYKTLPALKFLMSLVLAVLRRISRA